MKTKKKNSAIRLTHVQTEQRAMMVDVSRKKETERIAVAQAWVRVGPEIAAKLRTEGHVAKGAVLSTAELAGVMGAKQTASLIPMCHPLMLEVVRVEADLINDQVRITAEVKTEGKTGVEMEAMTAAAIAALTVYDMVKSAGKEVEIGPVRLVEKSGGKSGHWKRAGANNGTD